MRIAVDAVTCQCYGQCVFLAPNVFDLDEDGCLVFDEQPDATERSNVEAAMDACPVQAIALHD